MFPYAFSFGVILKNEVRFILHNLLFSIEIPRDYLLLSVWNPATNLPGTLVCVCWLWHFPLILIFPEHLLIINPFWLGFCWLSPRHPPSPSFGIFWDSLFLFFQFSSFKVMDTCIDQEAVTSHSGSRDFIDSKETTDFKWTARAGNADTWSRRLRLTILGIEKSMLERSITK